MHTIELINYIISVIFAVCYAYQYVYILVPLFIKPKAHKEATYHRYAALICARNESAVIGNCIESILAQKYPEGLIKVFVVADNCTDDTARVAREAGAHVYERFDTKKVGKGYALNFLFERIRSDFPKDAFDGYFIFDADNLVDENYTEEMNKTFCDGFNVSTCYRNSKNYGDNWLSAGYGLWFLRESRYLNGSRMLVGSGCAVSGTGFMISRRFLERIGGWNYFLLVEDIEFTTRCAILGERIGCNPKAIVYDEQPVKFRQSWRQRLRWSKGYLQVLQKYFLQLTKGIFRGSFTCYDMWMTIMPAFVLSIIGQVANITGIVLGFCLGGDLMIAIHSVIQMLFNSYIVLFVIGIITTITEWRNIYTSPFKKILYAFTFPLFMLTYLPISAAALFSKASWAPIEHTKVRKIADVTR